MPLRSEVMRIWQNNKISFLISNSAIIFRLFVENGGTVIFCDYLFCIINGWEQKKKFDFMKSKNIRGLGRCPNKRNNQKFRNGIF